MSVYSTARGPAVSVARPRRAVPRPRASSRRPKSSCFISVIFCPCRRASRATGSARHDHEAHDRHHAARSTHSGAAEPSSHALTCPGCAPAVRRRCLSSRPEIGGRS
eukprot:3976056-Prymnesium_polylepis.1